MVDSHFFEAVENLFIFDEFSDDVEGNLFSEIFYCFNDPAAGIICMNIFYEASVDLQVIHIHIDQCSEIRVPASEVVKGNFYPVLFDLFYEFFQHFDKPEAFLFDNFIRHAGGNFGILHEG